MCILNVNWKKNKFRRRLIKVFISFFPSTLRHSSLQNVIFTDLLCCYVAYAITFIGSSFEISLILISLIFNQAKISISKLRVVGIGSETSFYSQIELHSDRSCTLTNKTKLKSCRIHLQPIRLTNICARELVSIKFIMII